MRSRCVIGGAAHAVFVFDEPFQGIFAFRHDKARLVVVHISEIALEAPSRVLERLLARLGDVHRADQPQPVRVHRAAVTGGDIAGDLPVRRQRVVAERVGRGDADHAEVVLALSLITHLTLPTN
jgi:hypothetical protein